MEVDDPWDWSIDRVVQELCTDNRTWQPRAAPTSRPDPTLLEKALREQEVTGPILLVEVDEMVMRNDFGIVLGRRPFLRNAIVELRRRSVQYQASIRTAHPPSYNNFGLNEFAQLGAAFEPARSPMIQLPPDMPVAGAPQISAVPVNTSRETPSGCALADQSAAEGEYISSDASSGKRRKLNAEGDSTDVEFQFETGNYDATYHSDSQAASLCPEGSSSTLAGEVGRCTTIVVNGKERKRLAPTLITSEINPHRIRCIPTEADTVLHNSPHTAEPGVPCISDGKKRKRIAPTLVTSEIDLNRNRDIPTEADNVVHNDPQTVEPGVPYTGDDGRQRIMPIHQPDLETAEPSQCMDIIKGAVSGVQETGSSVSKRSRKQMQKARPDSIAAGYLGKRKIHVDDIFYGGTAVGEDLPTIGDDREFSQGIVSISSGRRIYVHNIMKHFLRSEPQDFARDGQLLSAVLPYSIALAPKFQKPSFTLFHPESDGKMHATRAELPSWPEVDPEAFVQQTKAVGGDNVAIFNLPGPEMLKNIGSYDDWDHSHLEKYRLLEGADDILPLYGESDSENEYDEALWREIEDERGSKLEKPTKALKKPPLSAADINTAIDEGISELVAKWKQKRQLKLQLKAYKTWQKSRKTGTWKLDIEAAQERLNHIIQRLAKMRSEILRDVWTSANQVRRQTTIMEQTISDREDLRWKITVLEKKRSPEKPPQLAPLSKPQKQKNQTKNVEGESVESDTDTPSSDDGLDDFIVDEDPITSQEELELNLADTELAHGDSTLSDASLPDSPNKAQNHRSRSPRTSVKLEQALPMHPKPPAANPSEIVDLTLISSDDGPGVVNLVTPQKRKKPLVRLYHRNGPLSSPIAISDEDNSGLLSPSQSLSLITDPAKIATYPNRIWETRSNRKSLLISILYKMDNSLRDRIFESISNISEESLWSHLEEVIMAHQSSQSRVKGMDNPTFETMTILLRLFEIFIDCKSYPYREPLSTAIINKLQTHELEWYSPFYKLCHQILDQFDSKSTFSKRCSRSLAKHGVDSNGAKDENVDKDDSDWSEDDDEDSEPLGSLRRRRSNGIAMSNNESSSLDETPRKNKRKLFEDAQARDLREQDRRRLAEQEQRRKRLQANLARSGHARDEEEGRIIINDAKSDDQGYILVHPQIAQRIKKHQVEGVRFMWNQIVADENSMQGCLLAHTMGLGKTMQVITLLVAIAEASASDDLSIVSQVPKRLRRSRTIVLCPPGLIDNWMDELLTWAPPGLLGRLLKVDSAVKIDDRLPILNTWYQDGGVLIIGYEMFRNFINRRPKAQDTRLDDENHVRICEQLLEGPDIIIADEAHKMKNSNASVTTATIQFKSKSRIALTGSPLANNILEYHTMIDWVAPNYLGPIREFRQKYAQPIQAGLWQDSMPYERRHGLKMLGVLKEDIAPKVHRADISVLRNDLPPKKEFIITVPLTDLQRKAYSLYVTSMMTGTGHARTKDGEVTQTTLWHWLAILSLLCNHPDCFNAKLHERKADAKKEPPAVGRLPTANETGDMGDDIANDLNTPIWKVGVSQDLINEEKILFDAVGKENMKSRDLSNKIKILFQILDAAKAVKDKVLVFSQSIPTLDFIENLCKSDGRKYARLDGKTAMSKRQSQTKTFNRGDCELYLISTSAGGLGLNLPGANRVVIFDFKFNPIMEEQAVGRAYRIGQKKPTFVYRFVAGGTFEDTVHNKTVFKLQLASRVVDKKSPIAYAKRKISDFLFQPRSVEQKDLSEFRGMDPDVLDRILVSQNEASNIAAIVQTDTFERDDDDKLTAEEENEVRRLLSDEQLKRTNPQAWHAKHAPPYRSTYSMPVNQAPVIYNGRADNGLASPSGMAPPSSINVVTHPILYPLAPGIGLPLPTNVAQLTSSLHAPPSTSPLDRMSNETTSLTKTADSGITLSSTAITPTGNTPITPIYGANYRDQSDTPNPLASPAYESGPSQNAKSPAQSNGNQVEGSNGDITKVCDPLNSSLSVISSIPHLNSNVLSPAQKVPNSNLGSDSSALSGAEVESYMQDSLDVCGWISDCSGDELRCRYDTLQCIPLSERRELEVLKRATCHHRLRVTEHPARGNLAAENLAQIKALKESYSKLEHDPSKAKWLGQQSRERRRLEQERLAHEDIVRETPPQASLASRFENGPLEGQAANAAAENSTLGDDSASLLAASSEDHPMPDASNTPVISSYDHIAASSEDHPIPDANSTPSGTSISSDNEPRR
ncbi:uncharacterized protein BP5553_00613 [Venustampulla echinocandica]|uniref:P-loop containing nucleoside triphosphate hydrolase n=1 Tax=Venustampulla echinocandica TaxID=2656787 RepID=A0A370TYN5_9HELO|nr:uncharacterized protein BP5553_00613 [Venustampulla echinocandica]RDL40634.1 hypothetical protein BP5553_00613 [Venustampulla echinocandica]